MALLPRDAESAAELARGHDDRVSDVHVEPGANHRIRHLLEVRNEGLVQEDAVRILRDAGVALAVRHAGDWGTPPGTPLA